MLNAPRRALTLTLATLLLVSACRTDDPPEPAAALSPTTTTATVAATAAPATATTATAAATTAPATATPIVATPAPVPTATPTLAVTATATPAAGVTQAASPAPLALVEVLEGRRFERPIEIGVYPPGRETGGSVFVAEQDGLVLIFHSGAESVLLDIRSRVRRDGNEEGLLSVAVDPAFEQNGHLWLYYSVAGGPRRSRLVRFTVDLAGDAFSADPDSELVVLEVEQPFANHNGGAIRFGPDGMLYLGLGDGGGGGDRAGNGQDPTTLLGTIIRIDVRNATAAQPYVVPPDNPGRSIAGARPELFAYGLRNPWRMAFDPATGALWVGDVGQGAVEEVDVVEAGGNYGWNILEGSDCFLPPSGCDRAGAVAPVATYRHDEGCSVTGGVVSRDPSQPGIFGYYLYGDFCSGRIWAYPAGGGGPTLLLESGLGISSFGTVGDAVYLLAFDAPVYRIVEAP